MSTLRQRPRPRVILLAATVVLAAAVGSCSSSGGPSLRADRTLVVAVGEEPQGFNWNKVGNEALATSDIAQNIFFYAFKAGPNYERTFPGLEGQAPPKLISANPQVVEWTIDRRAVWSDGTPVTSDDLIYFRSSILTEGSEAVDHDGYDQMTEVTVVDDKTIRATFASPYADYESLWTAVAQAAFMRSLATPKDPFPGLTKEPGPSAGPFVFDHWDRRQSITLVRNDRWWGDPKPALDAIVFQVTADRAAQIDALDNGEVDLITADADLDVVAALTDLSSGTSTEGQASTSGVHYELRAGPKWDLFTFNLQNPILADLRVRQAIAHALDRNTILDKVLRPIDQNAQRLDNFVYVTNEPEYQPHGALYQSPDLDAARQLLQDAGWELPASGGVRQRQGVPLSLRVSALAGYTRFEAAAELAIAQLKEVGIELRSDDCPLDCMSDRLDQGDFDILSAGWDGSMFPVSVISNIFSTDGPQNFGKFSSPAFDDLIGQAASVTDARDQAVLANRADEELWALLPGITLYQVPVLFAASDRFVGMGANPNGDGVFWNSNTWVPRG